MKKQGGITLVALIITVIILLILAGISIATLSNTGIFGKSEKAVNDYKNAAANEANILNEYENELNKYFE